MLTITIAINGIPITVVHGYRDTSDTVYVSEDLTMYTYRYVGSTTPMDLKGPMKLHSGAVLHNYDSGLNVLGELILNDMNGWKSDNEE